ncbi:hypothetical protein FISHEDRAFT_74639 [Fistulina hepatica ATCC 64428]|uniref:Uncharacterized protein n=1 Tax=Fistulina hepatica ATCC 64428 TaxID=1128425 RepID=A0A0D7AA27_9AGAR|nr:hypothetical protein FISHEDRAFT_74639 [Fistulina hepatica ATCC 64428]
MLPWSIFFCCIGRRVHKNTDISDETSRLIPPELSVSSDRQQFESTPSTPDVRREEHLRSIISSFGGKMVDVNAKRPFTGVPPSLSTDSFDDYSTSSRADYLERVGRCPPSPAPYSIGGHDVLCEGREELGLHTHVVLPDSYATTQGPNTSSSQTSRGSPKNSVEPVVSAGTSSARAEGNPSLETGPTTSTSKQPSAATELEFDVGPISLDWDD